MNTNNLKRFAQGARKKLLEQVSSKLEFVLSHETSGLKGKTETLKRLNDELTSMGKEALVDKVAYTWFNRLVALRFMDANGFQPMGINVITPISGISPQILEEAHAGHIPQELSIRREEVMNILDGRVSSVNPDNDAYRILLVASCNQLSSIFPFLFEKINDYIELLLPDDLTSSFSIIKDILNGMSDEDCQEVEIIGWLYQFYISEKKDEVFASGEKVKKEDIPAATQLFTPRWIVEYMVQNTLGKLWLQNKPNSNLRDYMPYYIESPSAQSEDYLKVNSVEEITLLDQASGSGHILVYGFELFSKIYDEEGYTSSEIPQLIIEKNLFGFEIDERAAQLAGFALMMKARSYHRRFFKREVKPNILCFQDLKLAEEEIKPLFKYLGITISDKLFHDLKAMLQATNFGSLIQSHTDTKTLEDTRSSLQSRIQGTDIFSRQKIENLIHTLSQLILLSQKYHCVVDNPPYMGSGNMNDLLLDFVKTNFSDSKSDLMASFMEAGLSNLKEFGFLGMINQHSWMFLSSYEGLRKKLIQSVSIDTLLHLGPRTFPEINGEVVQSASFSIIKKKSDNYGVYFRLVDFENSERKKEEFLKSVTLNEDKLVYRFNLSEFFRVPGYRLGYWLTEKAISTFENSNLISSIGEARRGLQPGKPDQFKRRWFEVSNSLTQTNYKLREDSLKDNFKWYYYNDGGTNLKWYGTLNYVIDWKDNGRGIKETGKAIIPNERLYLKEGITWSKISSGPIKARYLKEGIISGDAAPFFISDDPKLFLAFFNSKIVTSILKLLSATTNLTTGNIGELPFAKINESEKNEILPISEKCIEICEKYWNSREESWDFQKNQLLIGQDLRESFELYEQYWIKNFNDLKKHELDLNSKFIRIYGFEDELNPDVSITDITILNSEIEIKNGEIEFLKDEVISQFVSFFIGCLFGRFSLDKEALILANQGESLEDYFVKIPKAQNEITYIPDEDNIVPILDDVWFEDDIVSRFHEFLKASFGEKNFRKNLDFVEECLGKDVRKYFVKDFYKDHVKRYKKRPIYWSFSSPKGHFNVLIYMHRYTPDTLNRILNNYLREFIEKLQAQRKNLLHVEVTGTPAEQNKARKDIIKLDEMIADCRQYETDILYPLATERISIDLDDGVLVNYNKFGKAVTEVQGLNDKKTKDKVKGFDWIDTSKIK